MKNTLIIIAIIIGVGIVAFETFLAPELIDKKFFNEDYSYEREEVATTTEETTSPYPSDWLKEAEEAKQRVLKTKALEKEREDLEVKIKTINDRIAEIETELSF